MVYVYFMKVFFKTNSYGFHIFKLVNLKVIHNLYSHYLTQILSKTSFFTVMEGVSVCQSRVEVRGKK
jgi:hypothetical protein